MKLQPTSPKILAAERIVAKRLSALLQIASRLLRRSRVEFPHLAFPAHLSSGWEQSRREKNREVYHVKEASRHVTPPAVDNPTSDIRSPTKEKLTIH